MKNLIYLLFITISLLSSCQKDGFQKTGTTVNVSEDITSNETWLSEKTYIISGSVDVNSNAVLTIEAGTQIVFEAESRISVAHSNGFGAIRAVGTADKPILFTSQASLQNAGDWDGIFLYNGASGSHFEHCNFEYGGGFLEEYGMVVLKETEAGFLNCSFTNSASYGLSLDYKSSLSTFENNSFSNCFKNPILIYAKYLHNLGTGNSFEATSSILVMDNDLDVTGTYYWRNLNVPYDFRGTINVGSPSGTTIEIESGTVLNFSSDSEIKLAFGAGNFAVLKAVGTAAKPIIFSSSSPFPAAGDWNGIWFYEGTGAGTIFDYCNISYAGGNYYGGNLFLYEDVGLNVNVSNSTISYSENYGVYRRNVNYNLPVMTHVDFVSNTSGDHN